MEDKNFSAEWQKRIDEAMKGFPATFGLKAFPGKTFRVSNRASYVNESDDLMLYTQVKSNENWLDFCKVGIAELHDEIRPDPNDMSQAGRDARMGALIGVGTAPKTNEYEQRHEIEVKIAKKTIAAFLEAGYSLGVFDGEEVALRRCTDAGKVFEAMFSTDDDHLLVYESGEKGKKIGWVRFVYGNDGYDVINDYTTNLENQMQNVNDYAESLDPH